jgi:hypothetical protein
MPVVAKFRVKVIVPPVDSVWVAPGVILDKAAAEGPPEL